VAKNSYNSLRGIKDWRTDDANGEQNDLPALSKGKLKDFFYIRNLYGNIEDVFNRPVYSSPEDWIDVAIREPESTRGFFSKLVTTPQSRRCLNLGSYNYLGFGGLNTHCTPLVVKSVLEHPITSGSCSAELGYSTHVKQVEETTAKFVGKDSAVVVGMGFATNSTVIPALCGAGDLILSDALNHNSIVEGARLSGAKIKAFKHNCVGDLELLLQQAVAGKGARYNKILVIVEGIYSMEGELCKLPAIVEVCKLYGAYVWLDEAHSIGAVGATGRGVCEELGVDPADIDVMMGTFTKSFGAAGGYVAGDAETVARVRQYSAGCTDAVSMPPAVCTQILASLRVIAGEDGTDIGAKKLCQLRDNALFFRQGLEALGLEVLGEHPSPVMPVMLYQPYKIGDFSRLAFNRKLAVVVVGAPATPVTYPRVRFCVSAAHSREDLADALAAIGDIADELQIKFKLYPPARNALFGGATGSLSDVEKREEREREKRLEEALAARPAALEAAAALSGGRNTAKFAPLHSRGAPLGDDLGAPVTKSQKSSQGPADTYSLTGITAQPKKYDVVLSSQDVLGLTDDQVMKEECAATVETLGLGSCSPRGFYGTFPPHMDVEKSIAEFLGVQEAVLYSFGACTVSSVIPALAHRSDVAVVDRGVGHGVLAGLRLSKMDVRWYNHGDAEDCARVFANLEAEDGVTSARLARPGRRRWLITEGCFAGTGRIAPLPALLDLKDTHHARLILDESSSFGAMGATGRGITEHFGVDAARVDVIAASLENAGASVGGFCAGDTGVVAYQRLMGSGYVFSASLPPYLATAAAHAVRRIAAEPRLVARAAASAQALRDAVLAGRVPGLTTDADELSPVVPLRLAAGAAAGDQNALLAEIAKRARAKGVGVCVARINPLVPEKQKPPPALRAYASATRLPGDLSKALAVLAEAATAALPAHALGVGVDRARGIGIPPAASLASAGIPAATHNSPSKRPAARIDLDGTVRVHRGGDFANAPAENTHVNFSPTGSPAKKSPGRCAIRPRALGEHVRGCLFEQDDTHVLVGVHRRVGNGGDALARRSVASGNSRAALERRRFAAVALGASAGRSAVPAQPVPAVHREPDRRHRADGPAVAQTIRHPLRGGERPARRDARVLLRRRVRRLARVPRHGAAAVSVDLRRRLRAAGDGVLLHGVRDRLSAQGRARDGRLEQEACEREPRLVDAAPRARVAERGGNKRVGASVSHSAVAVRERLDLGDGEPLGGDRGLRAGVPVHVLHFAGAHGRRGLARERAGGGGGGRGDAARAAHQL
jgi:serine palmitoyltransferase